MCQAAAVLPLMNMRSRDRREFSVPQLLDLYCTVHFVVFNRNLGSCV